MIVKLAAKNESLFRLVTQELTSVHKLQVWKIWKIRWFILKRLYIEMYTILPFAILLKNICKIDDISKELYGKEQFSMELN